MKINGFDIIESITITKDGPPVEVPRTWRERLFTRPWRPRQRTKTVTTKVPAIWLDNNNRTVYMHPAMKRHFLQAAGGSEQSEREARSRGF